MRTLIFGAKGQLGRDLMTAFKSAGEVYGYDLPEVDIANEEQIFSIAEEVAPELIINSAAWTDVEGAEDDLESAFRVNELGARNVADVAQRLNIPVVYISTDFVFDGTNDTPYLPEDPVAPNGVYAKSKSAGETATRKANPLHFIVRTAWLYGPGGNSFPEKILRFASSNDTIKVVDDEVGSPTHTKDLAEAVFYLSRTKKYGTYHAVNSGQCSRYEFAQSILQCAEMNTKVEPCPATTYPSKAPRPAYSVLDTTSLEEATGHTMRSWKEALMDYMQRREEVVQP